MNTVKAQKTDDNNKPPLYRVVSDSEVIIQPRGATSNKLDDVYHLSPASPAKSLDNTEPLEDVFFASPNTVQDISETRSSHTSSSSSDGEFLKVMTYETFVADFCCVLFLRATCCACVIRGCTARNKLRNKSLKIGPCSISAQLVAGKLNADWSILVYVYC